MHTLTSHNIKCMLLAQMNNFKKTSKHVLNYSKTTFFYSDSNLIYIYIFAINCVYVGIQINFNGKLNYAAEEREIWIADRIHLDVGINNRSKSFLTVGFFTFCKSEKRREEARLEISFVSYTLSDPIMIPIPTPFLLIQPPKWKWVNSWRHFVFIRSIFFLFSTVSLS